jgi:hypothetical protein
MYHESFLRKERNMRNLFYQPKVAMERLIDSGILKKLIFVPK